MLNAAARTSGLLLWESSYDAAGFADEARAIATDRGRVYVAGAAQLPPSQFIVRAHDGRTGELLWQDLPDPAESDGAVNALAAEQGRVYAVGSVDGDFCVRAYDGLTGQLLWQESLDMVGLSDAAVAVAVERGRLYVAGEVTLQLGFPGFLGQALSVVRAYDGETGEVLWQDLYDLTTVEQATAATTIVAWRGRVFVGGSRNNLFFLRALNGETGALQWQQTSGIGRATGIAAGRGFVYATSEGFAVRAYNADTGAVVWEDTLDGATGRAVSVAGRHVFVAGVIPSDLGPDEGSDFLIRAYDADAGARIWQDQFHGAGNRTNLALAVDAGGAGDRLRVFTAGFVTSAEHNTDFIVQAYDGPSGALLWSDSFDTDGGLDQAVAVAAGQKRAYAAGFVRGEANGDFFVRAYDAR
jgi:outer membrane protein assembly factor BamB